MQAGWRLQYKKNRQPLLRLTAETQPRRLWDGDQGEAEGQGRGESEQALEVSEVFTG